VQLLASDLYSLRGTLSPTFPALNLVMPARDLRDPRSYHFGVTAESQMPGSLFLSLAYVGTRGLRLFRTSMPELGVGRSLVQFDSDVVPVVARPPVGENVVFPFLSGIMRPPQTFRVSNSFTVAPTLFESSASSTYHSLQIEVRRRYRAGVEFGSALTWSHSIDDASDFFDTAGAFALPQNSLHPDERGPSSFDVRLRSVSHFILAAPWRTRHRAFGGWELAGIITLEGGQPYTVNSALDVNRDGNLTDRLQTTKFLEVGNGDERIRLRVARGVNPMALLAPDGQNGAVGRNTFRAPGIANVDMALSKRLRLKENHSVMLRAEVFNVFNRTHFGIPVRILEAPGVGTSVNTVIPARTIQLALKYAY
jgi:hypothetical protein